MKSLDRVDEIIKDLKDSNKKIEFLIKTGQDLPEDYGEMARNNKQIKTLQYLKIYIQEDLEEKDNAIKKNPPSKNV